MKRLRHALAGGALPVQRGILGVYMQVGQVTHYQHYGRAAFPLCTAVHDCTSTVLNSDLSPEPSYWGASITTRTTLLPSLTPPSLSSMQSSSIMIPPLHHSTSSTKSRARTRTGAAGRCRPRPSLRAPFSWCAAPPCTPMHSICTPHALPMHSACTLPCTPHALS